METAPTDLDTLIRAAIDQKRLVELVYGKAALRSFVRTWIAELVGKSIHANMVSPDPIETPLIEAQFGPNVGAIRDRFKAMAPMQRIGQPEEVAPAVLFWRPTKAASSRASICQSTAAP